MGRKKLTNEEFIHIAESILGEGCTFEHTKYIDSKTNVIITCKKHGDFLRRPNDLISKEEGCPYCRGDKIKKSKAFTKQEFIKRAEKKYGKKYDYTYVNYINNKTNIVVICKEHGIFEINPENFLRGAECPECRKKK